MCPLMKALGCMFLMQRLCRHYEPSLTLLEVKVATTTHRAAQEGRQPSACAPCMPPACPDRLRTARCHSESTTPRSRGGSSLPGAPPLLRERGGSRTTRRRRRCRFGGGALGPRVVPYKVQPASVAITLQSVVEAPPVCPAAGPRRGGILETWDHEPVAAHGKVETCSMCEWTHPSCGGLGNGLGIARDSRKG